MFLNDLTGKAPVSSMYMVPVVASARAAKQNPTSGRTSFVGGEHTIDFSTGKNDVSMLVVC
jgi:hypothetical protein